MPRFEVMYKVFDDDSRRTSAPGSPSHYTMVVEALHQNAAEQMVKNMNGGDARCHIQRCMFLGN